MNYSTNYFKVIQKYDCNFPRRRMSTVAQWNEPPIIIQEKIKIKFVKYSRMTERRVSMWARKLEWYTQIEASFIWYVWRYILAYHHTYYVEISSVERRLASIVKLKLFLQFHIPKGRKCLKGTGIGLNPQLRNASMVVVSEASHTTLSYNHKK